MTVIPQVKLVGGTDIDRGYAFRPSVLEENGIQVWFDRTPTKRFDWRRFRFVDAVLVVEIWTDEDRIDFEPGNCWIEPAP